MSWYDVTLLIDTLSAPDKEKFAVAAATLLSLLPLWCVYRILRIAASMSRAALAYVSDWLYPPPRAVAAAILRSLEDPHAILEENTAQGTVTLKCRRLVVVWLPGFADVRLADSGRSLLKHLTTRELDLVLRRAEQRRRTLEEIELQVNEMVAIDQLAEPRRTMFDTARVNGRKPANDVA